LNFTVNTQDIPTKFTAAERSSHTGHGATKTAVNSDFSMPARSGNAPTRPYFALGIQVAI